MSGFGTSDSHANTAPSHVTRLILSVLISCLASFLPFAFSKLLFLTLPGALLTLLVFGRQVQLTSLTIRALCNVIVWSIGLYFGTALWKWGQGHPNRPSPRAANVVFVVWIVLLLPWFLLAGLSGMAFEGGATPEAYAFVWSVWTYAVTLGIVAVVRRWTPLIVLLPVLNIAGCAGSGLLH